MVIGIRGRWAALVERRRARKLPRDRRRGMRLRRVRLAGGVWAWAHPDSFDRIAARQVRSEWRRALIYAWPWKRVMLFSDLTKHTGHHHRRTQPYG